MTRHLAPVGCACELRLPVDHESSQGIGGETPRVHISERDGVSGQLHFPFAVAPRMKCLHPVDRDWMTVKWEFPAPLPGFILRSIDPPRNGL